MYICVWLQWLWVLADSPPKTHPLIIFGGSIIMFSGYIQMLNVIKTIEHHPQFHHK